MSKAPTELSAETQSLVEKLSQRVVVDDKGRVTLDENAYWDHLPPEITKEHVKAVRRYNAHILPAAAKALSDKQAEIMIADHDILTNTGHFDMGDGDYYTTQLERSRQYTGGLRAEDGTARPPVTKYGVLQTSYVTASAVRDKGEMLIIRNALEDKMMAAFGS